MTAIQSISQNHFSLERAQNYLSAHRWTVISSAGAVALTAIAGAILVGVLAHNPIGITILALVALGAMGTMGIAYKSPIVTPPPATLMQKIKDFCKTATTFAWNHKGKILLGAAALALATGIYKYYPEAPEAPKPPKPPEQPPESDNPIRYLIMGLFSSALLLILFSKKEPTVSEVPPRRGRTGADGNAFASGTAGTAADAQRIQDGNFDLGF